MHFAGTKNISSYTCHSLLDMVSRPEGESLQVFNAMTTNNKPVAMTRLLVQSVKQRYYLNTVQKEGIKY